MVDAPRRRRRQDEHRKAKPAVSISSRMGRSHRANPKKGTGGQPSLGNRPGILALLGIVLLGTWRLFATRWFSSQRIRLPARKIVTIFPSDVNVSGSLPYFFWNYAISTPNNSLAREAVARVAQQRVALNAEPNANYSQKILYTAWEHSDFHRQLYMRGKMDEICGGTGYQALYETYNYSEFQSVADTLLLTCLFRSGTADGYVKRTVHLKSPMLTRGLKGVAAKYMDGHSHLRIHSDFLILPILSGEDMRASGVSIFSAKRQSTALPVEMTKFLLSTLSNKDRNVANFMDLWEEFLYQTILQERHQWILLQAACSPEERSRFTPPFRLVATTCVDNFTVYPSSASRPVSNCCSFYDDDDD